MRRVAPSTSVSPRVVTSGSSSLSAPRRGEGRANERVVGGRLEEDVERRAEGALGSSGSLADRRFDGGHEAVGLAQHETCGELAP